MKFEFSPEAQTIRVYNLSSLSNEFIGEGDAYIPADTGLPAHCTHIKPPACPQGHALVWSYAAEDWEIKVDLRGTTIYHKVTRETDTHRDLGEIPDTYTTLPPVSDYSKWDGSEWVEDLEAIVQDEQAQVTAKLSGLISNANDQIACLSDAVELGMATDDEANNLVLWKKYRVLLSRVDPAAPVWPEFPTE